MAYVCFSFDLLSYIIVGFFCGYLILGVIVNPLALKALWGILLKYIGGLIFGVICMKLKEKIMVIITAFCGSLLISYMTLYLFNLVGNPMDSVERIWD